MNYIIEKDQLASVLAAWKQPKSHTASQHVIYNVLRGYEPKRGFTPITRPTKLANGAEQWFGYDMAIFTARWELREINNKMGRFSTEAQALIRASAENDRIKATNTKYGIEITSELRTKLLELLK
jgi:hypothetical protein